MDKDLARALLELPAKSLDQLLLDLVERWERVQAGSTESVPRVTLHLRSGRDVQGHLLARKEERGQRTLLVYSPGADRASKADAVIVPEQELEGVTVHDVPQLSHAPAGSPPPPTALALRRLAAQTQERLFSDLGTSMDIQVEVPSGGDGEPMRALAELLGHAGEILAGLAQDPLGRDSVRRIRTLHLSLGPSATARLEGTQLSLITPTAPAGRRSQQDLRKAIETVL